MQIARSHTNHVLNIPYVAGKEIAEPALKDCKSLNAL